MSRLHHCLFAILLFAAASAEAQDTRGGLVPGTAVSLADGKTIAVENLKVGTMLLSWDTTGKVFAVKLTEVRRMHADSYLLIKAGDQDLQATGAQRISLADGSLVRFDSLKAGMQVRTGSPSGPLALVSPRLYPASLIAYDLTTEDDRPFLAGGFVVGD